MDDFDEYLVPLPWHMEEGVEYDCCVEGFWCKFKLGNIAVNEFCEWRICFG